MIPRIDQLDAPPQVMRYYMVPTVRYPMWGRVADWPVMGVRHTDVEHLEFPARHFHFDHRFVTPTQFQYLFDVFPGPDIRVASVVLSEYDANPPPAFPSLPAEPVWKRKRCYRAAMPYPHHRLTEQSKRGFPALWASYYGRTARKNEHGHWLCPHRNFALGSAPCVNGVITCPLHGLRINAATGAIETDGYFEQAAA